MDGPSRVTRVLLHRLFTATLPVHSGGAQCLSRAPRGSIMGLDAGAGHGVCKSPLMCPYDVDALGLRADLRGAMRHRSEARPYPAVGPRPDPGSATMRKEHTDAYHGLWRHAPLPS